MAQHDYSIANASGASVRADLNNVLAAIKSLNAGASAPSGAVEGMMWVDTTNHKLKIYDGAGWEEIGDYNNKGLGLLDDAELTGDPTAPTQPVTDKSTKIATTAWVNSLTSSETRAGIVEKATDAEVDGRTDNSRWFSVKQLLRIAASTTAAGLARFATNNETSTGTSIALAVTPAGLASMRASTAETEAGSSTTKFSTPAGVAGAITDATDAIKGGVSSDGDTLKKLYDLIGGDVFGTEQAAASVSSVVTIVDSYNQYPTINYDLVNEGIGNIPSGCIFVRATFSASYSSTSLGGGDYQNKTTTTCIVYYRQIL